MLFNIYKLSYIHYLPIKNQFFPMINWKQRYFLPLISFYSKNSIQVDFKIQHEFKNFFVSLSLSINPNIDDLSSS